MSDVPESGSSMWGGGRGSPVKRHRIPCYLWWTKCQNTYLEYRGKMCFIISICFFTGKNCGTIRDCGGVHSSPMSAVARESTATNSVPASNCAVTPEGVSEDISLPSDAAIDSLSSSWALNEKWNSPVGKVWSVCHACWPPYIPVCPGVWPDMQIPHSNSIGLFSENIRGV